MCISLVNQRNTLIMAGKGQTSGFIGNPSGKNQYVEKRGEGKRTERLLLRVTPVFKEKVRQAAQQDNQSMTEWLEKVVNSELLLRESSLKLSNE